MKLTTYAQIGALLLASTAAFAESHEAASEEDAQLMIVEAALAGGDAAAGEKIFKKCKACHMVGEGAKTRTGPALNNVVGAEIGETEGFKYSAGMVALAEADEIWTIENLNALLTKPKDFVEKTKMSFAGLKDEQDRADLIAYLAGFTVVEADD